MKKWLPVLAFALVIHEVHAQTKQEYTQRITLLESAIRKNFYDSTHKYYKEATIIKADQNPYSYLWPLCGLIQAANEVDKVTGSQTFPVVLGQIQPYYDPAPPAPGYASYIVSEKKEDRFYDDNQWIAIACLDAFQRTRQKPYLDQAKMIYHFMMTGYDTVSGGGLYWREGDKTTKNTCSNGPGVLIALQLYKITREKAYLDTALMLYNWVNQHLRSPEGLYDDNIKLPSRAIDTHKYTYNTGTMLESAVLLYEITKKPEYLEQAKQSAQASLDHFFRNGRFPSNYWFNVVMFRGYLALARNDQNKAYLNAMRAEGEAIWSTERDNNNLLGKKERKELLDQAAALEIFARLAQVSTK